MADIKWPSLDIAKILEEAGVLAIFTKSIQDYLAKAEATPGTVFLRPELLNALFSDAMKAAPGVLNEKMNAIPEAALKFFSTGKSKPPRDPSALA